MPQLYVYVCPQCGTRSEEGSGLPASWFSINLPANTTEPSRMEYFDTWNCLSVYAGEQTE